MSLPAGQQRILNSMDHSLQAREPRLAAMFEVFTRLTAEEGWPAWEQLASGQRTGCCRRRLRARRRARARRAARSGQRRPAGVRGGLHRVLMLCPLLTVLAVVGLLLGLSPDLVPAACRTATAVTVRAAQVGGSSCQLAHPALPAK